MSLELILASSLVALLVILLPTLFLLSQKLGPLNTGNKAKNSLYESGISSPIGSSESRFSAKFYLVAILFVLFDVEIIFMFPWAVNVRELSLFGLFEMFTFIGLLLFGLIYIYRIKALSWQ
ncbi:NADH ubiquinone oxidoreductase chain A [Sulfurospirillum diekertiae]|uniref:NADH-quinone oxidoreductase subunit n=1 Tax=Sulfurospirillum diekertiae TaxID=1854492 RepID=A0A290HSH2_9BACT|nr:NADH-quinone oxidoreductase subunit A [Sulfurospirillum diekertiae]ATB68600.1 NADH ubiquinone oxidoreductase chain A [Sulfurospirillum diekertiae]